MKDIVGDKSPEFWPESNCPFFCLPTGSSSCYTDEMSTTLACLASDGNINTSNIATAIQTKFGRGVQVTFEYNLICHISIQYKLLTATKEIL